MMVSVLVTSKASVLQHRAAGVCSENNRNGEINCSNNLLPKSLILEWLPDSVLSERLGHDWEKFQAGLNGVHEELYSHTAVISPCQVPPQHGEVLIMDMGDSWVLGVIEDHQLQHQDEHERVP